MTVWAPRPVRILFRAGARPSLGGGHVMRCLSLADAFQRAGCDIAFASERGSESLVPALARSGHPVFAVEHLAHIPMPPHWRGRADIIVCDLYDTTAEDEKQIAKSARLLVCFEDLPDRRHACDILIDQAPGAHAGLYDGRIGGETQLLLGPDYFPARHRFSQLRPVSLSRRTTATGLKTILIAMGLTDVDGISEHITRQVIESLPEATVSVVLGPHAASLKPLNELARTETRLRVLVDVEDMASEMSTADLAIGAGGGTALERCILGLPSIIVTVADNQRALAAFLQSHGIVLQASPEQMNSELPALLDTLSPDRLRDMSSKSAALCDGRGADRAATIALKAFAERKIEIRPANGSDIWTVHDWRNRDHVRTNMYRDTPIDRDEHEVWFADTLADPGRDIGIIRFGGRDIGVVILYDIDREASICRWAFYIGEIDALGHGVGSEVERQVLHYVFEQYGLQRLQCEVLGDNHPVIGLHRKFGFRPIAFPPDTTTASADQARAVCLELSADTWRSMAV